MPVTIVPASHKPKPLPPDERAKDALSLLQFSCPEVFVPGKTRIVASSSCYSGLEHDNHNVYPSSSSFVRSAVEAWGRHSHLVIRPEDIWFTILVQLNFYMERNAEHLRHLFVSHAGQEHIHVSSESWQAVLGAFRQRLHDSVQAGWLSDWVLPGFSTSTEDDEVTATVLMMGLMRKYFTYGGDIICGIPSVTLLGTRADWERLLGKLDRLPDFGAEPTEYRYRLRPLLTRVVASFDAPAASGTRQFWDQLVQAKVRHDHTCGRPERQYMVSGWILGFYYWDATGRPSEHVLKSGWGTNTDSVLEYDGIKYREVALEHMPVGYAKAKFTMLNDHGGDEGEFKGWVLAGNVGKLITEGPPEAYQQAKKRVAPPQEKALNLCQTLKKSFDCFRSHSGRNTASNPISEKAGTSSRSDKAGGIGHTIQPLSGWFLFGPDQDIGPFYEGEEIDGPTVDAIDSCEGIEHFMITGNGKASKYDVANKRPMD